jgi:hypothetical protein
VDNSTKGTKGQKIHDADLSLCTLTGSQVLEMPKMKSSGDFSVPDPKTDEQRFWVAALHYCLNLARPRPSRILKGTLNARGDAEKSAMGLLRGAGKRGLATLF